MSEEYNNYRLLIDWLIHPNRFFKKLNEMFVNLSNKKKTIFCLLSYLIPIVCGLELYLIWTSFAINIISDRIVSGGIILGALIGGAGIANLLLLTYLPGRGIKKRINERLEEVSKSQKLNGKNKRNNEEEEKAPKLKTFSRLYLMRNNIYFTPVAIVLGGVVLTNISRAWNIYYLGAYLTITTWIFLIWIGYFAFSSLYSVGVEFRHIKLPKITKSHFTFKIIISLCIYIGFVVALSIPLTIWLGAKGMPFWYKFAMFLLHGN